MKISQVLIAYRHAAKAWYHNQDDEYLARVADCWRDLALAVVKQWAREHADGDRAYEIYLRVHWM